MIQYRFLQPEEFSQIDHRFDEQGVPRLDPQWTKVVAALDSDTDQIVGILCLQLVAHMEPILIEPSHRGQGIWHGLAEMMDGYCASVGLTGVYTQPTSAKSEAMAVATGFSRRETPLYVKIYSPDYLSLTLSQQGD